MSSGSSGFAWVHSYAPTFHVGSFGESSDSIGFTLVHSCETSGRRVHPGLRGFIRALQGGVGFIWVRRARLVDVGFIRFRVGSIRRSLDSSGLFVFAWVHSGAPRGLRVLWVWREFNLGIAVVARFSDFRLGSLVWA